MGARARHAISSTSSKEQVCHSRVVPDRARGPDARTENTTRAGVDSSPRVAFGAYLPPVGQDQRYGFLGPVSLDVVGPAEERVGVARDALPWRGVGGERGAIFP